MCIVQVRLQLDLESIEQLDISNLMNRRLDMPQKLTPEIIEAAIKGFQSQKAEIDSQIAELRSMLPGGLTSPVAMPSETGTGKRKKFSLASRKKMAAAQRARYAKLREAAEAPQAEAAKPKKRKMSAAGRRAISIATKKRWAAIKAARKVA
jgi:hypothetical protein